MRGILTVPFDKNAMERFSYDKEERGDVITACFSDKDYDAMWKTDFYRTVNAYLDIMIDYAETEMVVGKENLQKLYSIIVDYEDEIDNPLFDTLKCFTKFAIKFDTCIVFDY